MVLKSISIASILLSSATINPPSPWLKIEASSEQRTPVYIGARPRAMELTGYAASVPTLSESLRRSGERQAKAIRKALGLETVELEAWPVQDDQGRRTWAFSRWRDNPRSAWQWLEKKPIEKTLGENFEGMLPATFAPWRKRDASKLFDDFLDLNSLYDKPLFGECIWTNEAGNRLLAAWLPPAKVDAYRDVLSAETRPGMRAVCRHLPQLARFNEKPVSMPIRVSGAGVEFPTGIEWVSDELKLGQLADSERETRITSWPRGFKEAYSRDVMIYAGEKQARFPLSGRRSFFKRKSSADPRNQLKRLVEYLEERYEKLGIRTYRQSFFWRGIEQINLIAVIPGSASDASQSPVLLADHIDTAFSEKHFDKTGERVAAPGADDNGSAFAALLRAADVLRGRKPLYDIHLVHLTGEEFPADCLGARHYVSLLLKNKRDIRGLILLDMIGYKDPRYGNKFQINAGESAASVKLARLAYAATRSVAPELEPIFRSRFDQRSYLYNTDGIIFSDAGYPVILLNEYINKLENFNRPHYHQTTDTSDTLDWDYATAITKVAIETAARLAVVSGHGADAHEEVR